MTSDGLRRRQHGDDSEIDSVTEPLLNHKDAGVHLKQRRTLEKPGWSSIFFSIILKWARWFAHIVKRSANWLGKMLLCGCAHERGQGEKFLILDLSPIQEERLRRLQMRVETSFDREQLDHQEALKALWLVAFPDTELHGLVSDQWKDMGWQGNDPSTDFRGGGFVSLENLLFFARTFPKTFQKLLCKKGGRRATWEYPFAVAGVNLTFMLIQMLDLRSEKPSSCSGSNFLKILAEEESAFDLLYCVAFAVMDSLWLAMHASYMEFNVQSLVFSIVSFLNNEDLQFRKLCC